MGRWGFVLAVVGTLMAVGTAIAVWFILLEASK
jgi:hypothetical protein